MADSQSIIPLGFCQCGCGQPTKIAEWDNRTNGDVKGQPRRFVIGHHGVSTPALVGQRFGRLLVLSRVKNKGERSYWLCRCDCGAEHPASTFNLRHGETASCGCLSRELLNKGRPTHGESRPSAGGQSREYRAWAGAKDRCFNHRSNNYENYGGRGITMCDRWRDDFPAFLADVGRCPGPGFSLDRFPNNNGNYEPGNVRWATSSEQNNNQRKNRRLTFNGQTHTLTEWARLLGLNRSTLKDRIASGWSVDRALSKAERADLKDRED